MKALRYRVRVPVSASIQVADADGDGVPEFLLAARRVESLSPSLRPLRVVVQAAPRPFASTPAVVDSTHGPSVLVGCDDGGVYATGPLQPPDGQGRRPWVKTGLDVYSSPVVGSTGPGRTPGFVAFGSDDGHVWVVGLDGEPLPGFPAPCGAFVSATPCVGDLDGDGRPEVMVGDWGGGFHAFRLDGTELPGFPVDVGQRVWSSATMADIDGDGHPEVVFATRRLHAMRSDGRAVAGFPRLLGSYAVSSPIVVDLLRDGRATIILGADRLYAFDGAGNAMPWFPTYLDDFVWASPVTFSRAGASTRSVVVGTWGGKVFEVDGDNGRGRLLCAGNRFFASAAILADGGGGCMVAAASWDGFVYGARVEGATVEGGDWPTFHRDARNARVNGQRFRPPEREPAPPDPVQGGPPPTIDSVRWDPARPKHREPVFVKMQGWNLAGIADGAVRYTVAGEGREHPTPLFMGAEGLVALIQPLGAGRRVRFWVDAESFSGQPVNFPGDRERSYVVQTPGPFPLGRLIEWWEGRR